MGHFPYIKNFRIYVQKTPEEVRDILKGETAVWGMGNYPLGDGAFVGEVGTSYFKVVPRPSWLLRTYSMAVMEGSIKAEDGETVVDVKMRFPWQTYLFFPVSFLIVMGGVLLNGAPPIVCILAFVMLCVFWVILRSEFHFVAERGRRHMEELLGETEEVDWDVLG